MRYRNSAYGLVRSVVVSALCTAITVASHAQNLIVNGSFETPNSNNHLSANPGTWHLGQSFGGWTVSLNNVHIMKAPVPYSYIPASAYHGQQYLDVNGLGGKGAVYQNVVTSTPGLYQLKFAMNGIYGGSFPKTFRTLRVSITNLATNTLIYQNDFIHTFNNLYSATNQPWEVFSVGLTLSSAGAYRVEFADLGFSGTEAGPALDDVSFQLVPEPASWIALGSGLVSMMALRRRRR